MTDRPRVPAPRASRPAVGSRARTAARPLTPAEIAGAERVSLREVDAGSIAAAILALPDPAALAPGTLVIVPAEIASPRSLAKSVLAVFGRTKTVSRANRCSALLARGYIGVGAAEDDEGASGDLAWGRAPGGAGPGDAY